MPDISNMIPCKLTGKPFWQIYLYQDPPLWVAYIEALKRYGFDSLWDGMPVYFPEEEPEPPIVEVIIEQTPERIVTQCYQEDDGKKKWAETVKVYRKADPPHTLRPAKIGLPPEPKQWRPVEGRKEWPTGGAALKMAREMMGDHGIIGVSCGGSLIVRNEEEVYEYAENPDKYRQYAEERLHNAQIRFRRLMAVETHPDFIATGGSGTLIFQTPKMVRELSLPIIKRMAEMAKEAGIFSHIHSCGPETALVKMCAEETQLSVIDPLEIPPMGDCNLKKLKQLYGRKLTLKGNLHTTSVMLRGTVAEVQAASRQAIDDAAEGGRYILGTGDQCGRDTPEDNLRAMIDTARTYGRYK
jgi:uroporphyrinogen decarboxylase